MKYQPWLVRLVIVLVVCFVLRFAPIIHAQSAGDIQKRIDELQQKVSDLQGEKNSLSKQINLLNSQIDLTTLRISSIRGAIDKLTGEIGELNSEIDRLEALKTKRLELVLHRIPETYKRTQVSQFGIVLFSKDFSDFLSRVKYLSHIQQEDTLVYKQLQNTQDTYGERKSLREKKKIQSETLKNQFEQQSLELARQKKEKQTLLDQTKNSETVYQQLLTQARLQLVGFASFASSQGGGLLSGQTICDGWGCYYNQRDSQWGGILMNGRNDCNGPCSIERVGCLITSIAMIVSHMGRKDILPVDIALSDPDNFAVGTAMLRFSINVKGVTISRISASLTPDSVRNEPVVVGIRYGPFGTHFVVVKSYTDGKYIMNDPYQAGGHDKVFTDSYSLGSVFEVSRVSM